MVEKVSFINQSPNTVQIYYISSFHFLENACVYIDRGAMNFSKINNNFPEAKSLRVTSPFVIVNVSKRLRLCLSNLLAFFSQNSHL